MKTLVILITVTLFSITSFAQNEKYVSSMKASIEQMFEAKSIADYQKAANKFEMIGKKESSEWLPQYYGAQCYILMSFVEKDGDRKDELLDKAQNFIDNALKIKENESELYVLQGWLHQGRIMVSAMRGMKYSMLASRAFEKAKELNPENPRIYYLKGHNVYGTPAMFGGGAEKALPLFKTAKEKYDAFKPENEIWPSWGKESNEKMLASCENS